MGQLCAKTSEEGKTNAAIAKQNKADHAREQLKIKMLLLGSGESGKSALFKQIRVLFGPKEEPTQWKQVVHGNVIEFTQTLIKGAEKFGIPLANPDDAEIVLHATQTTSLATPTPDKARTMGEVIEELWKDPALRDVFERRADLQVNEAHVVFMDRVAELAGHEYMPTPEDIVLARVRTTGVHSDIFEIDGRTFAIFDVGGQRNERRKWIHIFDDVSAIMFVVGLSDYDQNCFEDVSRNRIVDALELFDKISNDPLFAQTPIILFLNKSDLLENKLASHPIANTPAFSDFTGGDSFEDACAYFRKKFVDIALKIDSRTVYPYVTNATNPHNVDHVFKAARDIVMQSNLKASGLY